MTAKVHFLSCWLCRVKFFTNNNFAVTGCSLGPVKADINFPATSRNMAPALSSSRAVLCRRQHIKWHISELMLVVQSNGENNGWVINQPVCHGPIKTAAALLSCQMAHDRLVTRFTMLLDVPYVVLSTISSYESSSRGEYPCV